MKQADGLCIYMIDAVSWHYLAFENTSRAHDQIQTGARCAFVSAVYPRILPVFTSMQILQALYAPALWNLHLQAAWLYTIPTPLLLVRVPNPLPRVRRGTCLLSSLPSRLPCYVFCICMLTKFRRSTGVTTANSTNKYQNYKSVELGDQLHKIRPLTQWKKLRLPE